MKKGIRRQIEDVCKRMSYDAQKLFVHAFQSTFGKRRGILREARAAYARFSAKGSLTARARKALTSFIDSLRGNSGVATA